MKFVKNYSKEYKIQLTKALLEEIDNDLIDEKEPEIKLLRAGTFYDETLEFLNNPNKFDGIRSGFDKLDGILRGFIGGELTILTGVSGHGKTTFLEAMLINMALDSEPVLFISLEENGRQILAKMFKQIKEKTLDPELAEYYLRNMPLYLYDGEVADINVLEVVVKEAVANGIKFIAVDNIGFFSKRDTEEESQISIKLKLMARKYNVPILAVAHLRKLNNIDKIPTMDDIKGSSSTYQDADQFLCLWQDMTGAKAQKNDVLLLIRKNRRYGTRGTVQFYVDDNLFFKEINTSLKELY